ncbi:MAG: hypothetical protein DME28_00450 [Verrucomicrobia bacterium]|nr:MAG: hypothetical protein DME41_06670 [Verrucomicrobiota bacterium]PYL95980.1 MAG: hypothetical protein DME28_00450 [Verrucomicrobiota bacterium]
MFRARSYNASMKNRSLILLVALAIVSIAAGPPDFAGEYADRNFLSGQATFQMSLEQSGSVVTVWFSAGYNDGHGLLPVADGNGKITSKGTAEFTFKDSARNAGTGTITRAGDDIIVSLKTTRVADSRCVELYRQNMRLKKVGKK